MRYSAGVHIVSPSTRKSDCVDLLRKKKQMETGAASRKYARADFVALIEKKRLAGGQHGRMTNQRL